MPTSISILQEAASRLYPAIITELSSQSTKKYRNDKLSFSDLTAWRNEELPQKLKSLYDDKKEAYLTKDELRLLLDWKLANGKFRPTLPKLIDSNDANDIELITKDGLGILLDFVADKDASFWKEVDEQDLQNYTTVVKKSLKKLCELRGVGPATGSLILSLVTKIAPHFTPPFFSDESFLYYVVDSIRPGTKIKYNVKEYFEELLPVYYGIVSLHPELTFDTLEKGAWSLKSYALLRIDKLINVKLPFETTEDDLQKFSEESTGVLKKEPKREPKEVAAIKRKAEAESNPPTKRTKRTTK
ncbi:hypothetical protein G9P44_000163 [Scheffersomyces stipitis]|nr:hypothetical protein G9P44_000163 [Scheffersomyces stipitis]